MNGIVFLGCSFTWGQGLYFYSGLDTLKLPDNEYMFNQNEVTHAHIMYKNKFRFARLVADEFKTFELSLAIVKIKGYILQKLFLFYFIIFSN